MERVVVPAPVGEPPDALARSVLRELAVQPDPEAIGEVRSFVAEVCREWGLETSSDTAVLLASELATNAVRYARTPVIVWLGRRPDRIVLSVEDASPESAVRRSAGSLDEGGRGLQIVDALAQRWGEKEVPRGKLVWAELATGRAVSPA